MTPAARRIAYAALGLAVARVLAGARLGRRRPGALGALSWLSLVVAAGAALRATASAEASVRTGDETTDQERADASVAGPESDLAAIVAGQARLTGITAAASAGIAERGEPAASPAPPALAPPAPAPPRRPPTLAVLLARGADF